MVVETLCNLQVLNFLLLSAVISWPLTVNAVVIFNVGLPRTGTTSVHKALPLLNFSSNHVAFNKNRFDLESKMSHLLKEFRNSGGGPLNDFFNVADGFSDTPCYGIIPQIKKYYPNVAVVATWRSKVSWLDSMKRNPMAGGAFLTAESGLLPLMDHANMDDARLRGLNENHETKKKDEKKSKTKLTREERLEKLWTPARQQNLETIYDNHEALLQKYDIPKIDIAVNESRSICQNYIYLLYFLIFFSILYFVFRIPAVANSRSY